MGEADGVQPDVGVDAFVPVPELDPVQRVECRSAGALDRLLEPGLEALAHVEDEVGLVDPLHLAGRQFEVVRLGAGRGQVLHLHAVAAHLLGGERQRIEAGDDLPRPRGGAGAFGPAAGGRTRKSQHSGE